MIKSYLPSVFTVRKTDKLEKFHSFSKSDMNEIGPLQTNEVQGTVSEPSPPVLIWVAMALGSGQKRCHQVN